MVFKTITSVFYPSKTTVTFSFANRVNLPWYHRVNLLRTNRVTFFWRYRGIFNGFSIDIKESVKELKIMIEDYPSDDQLKLCFLILFKENKNISYFDISEILGVRVKKLIEWKDLYESGGINLLLGREILENNTDKQETELLDSMHTDETPTKMPETQAVNQSYTMPDVYELKKWITENYITQKECMTAINDLKKMVVAQKETVSVLKRIIKLLNI